MLDSEAYPLRPRDLHLDTFGNSQTVAVTLFIFRDDQTGHCGKVDLHGQQPGSNRCVS